MPNYRQGGNMWIVVSFIPGFMVGIEYLWEEHLLVIDLAIIRIMITNARPE